jgi:flagellar L-ring protein precursor FlgH
MTDMFRPIRRALPLVAISLSLAACADTLERLQDVGGTPRLTSIENPTAQSNYRPVSLPMPAPTQQAREVNSLWQPGSRAFFKDQRAGRVGDLLTVLIEVSDKAKLQNDTSRERDNTETGGIGALLGFEGLINRILPGAPAGTADTGAVNITSAMKSESKGSVDRNETINLKIAAVITQVLPNGNLVIQGRQEIRVNGELRELLVAGVIRPEDVSTSNTIGYEKIAEARIAYGGRGTLSDIQRPRYGQQLLDIILPF